MRNESEKITAVKNSLGVISKKTALSNHPWVKDVDAEMEQLEDEVGEPIDFNEPADSGGVK
jgi:hypothetical protein